MCTLQPLQSFVDEKEAGYSGRSGAISSWFVTWETASDWLVDPIVPPGSNTVAVEIFQNNPPNSYTSDPASELTVQDIDTHDTVGHISLPVQSVTSLPNMGKITDGAGRHVLEIEQSRQLNSSHDEPGTNN